MVSVLVLIIGLVCLGVGAVLFIIGRAQRRKRDLVARVVTSPASQVRTLLSGAPVAVTGMLRCDTPLTAELSQRPCAYVDFRVTRKVERRKENSDGEAYTDRSFETVASGQRSIPFYVEDASGRVLVRPEGAEVDAQQVVDRFEQGAAGASAFGQVGASATAPNPKGGKVLGYQYEERILPVDAAVYVVGATQEDGEIGRLPQGSRPGKFIISYRSEDALAQAWGQNARRLTYASAAVFVVGAVLILVGLLSLVG